MEGLLVLAAVFCAIAAAGGAMAGCLLARRPEKPATPPPPEDEAEPLARARLERILANIDLYDGTPAGQQRIE